MNIKNIIWVLFLVLSVVGLQIMPVWAQLEPPTVPPVTPPVAPQPTPLPEPVPVSPVTAPPAPPATLPSDTTPPVISGVASLSLGIGEATLVWITDESAISHLEYGVTSSYGTEPTLPASALLAHTAVLTSLSVDTTYYYCIHATDLSGNTADSCNHSFVTAALPILTDTTPPDITAITVAPITSTSVTINWTTAEVANGQIEYGLTAGYGNTTIFDTDLALTHSLTLSDLSPNTTYHYRIITGDEIGNETVTADEEFTTELSGNVSAGITDTTPPAISEVGSVSLGLTDATIAWTTNELAVSTLEYGLTANYGSQVTLPTSLLLAHTATLTGLSAGTTYYYCIHATDLIGNTATSCPHSFATTALGAPVDTTPPAISLVTATSVTTSTASVAWTTNEPASAEVQYGLTASYGSLSALHPVLDLAHSVELSGLSSNTTYHYRVKSTDDAGNVSFGPDQIFTTEAQPMTQQAQLQTSTLILSGVETSLITTTAVIISWHTDLPADSQVEYGDSNNLGFLTELSSTLTTDHSVSISSLISNTNYIFRVKSKPIGGTVATVSDNYEFNTLSHATSIVSAANIISVSSSGVTSHGANISWITDKVATSQVEYGISTSYGSTAFTTSGLTPSHSVELTDLSPHTTYHFRVKSTDEASNITYSEDYTFTTPNLLVNGVDQAVLPSAPSAVTNLLVGGYDEGSVELVWHVASANADITEEYEVRYSTSPITVDNFNMALQAQTTPIFYTDLSPLGALRVYIVAGLLENTAYYFALKSKYENSSFGDLSNVVLATTTTGASVNNNVVTQTGVVPAGGGNSGGGGGSALLEYGVESGGNASAIFEPTLLKAEPADSQIIFSWHNPGESNFVRTVVLRKEGSYPTSPLDGTILYEGRAETFTDINVVNGKTYYYAVYAYNHSKTYSSAVRVSVAPKEGNKQLVFNESGFVESILPIYHFTRVFKKGDKDIEIEHLQEVLSADNDVYPQKYITGYFGSLTEAALKRFQTKHGIPQTGITDSATQEKLNMVDKSEEKLEVPADYTVFVTDMKLGNQSEVIKALQRYLVYEGSLSPKYVTGYFGSATKAAVMSFQKKYGVKPVSGYVGVKTRHRMRQLTGL